LRANFLRHSIVLSEKHECEMISGYQGDAAINHKVLIDLAPI
jgi:hypothetical protein